MNGFANLQGLTGIGTGLSAMPMYDAFAQGMQDVATEGFDRVCGSNAFADISLNAQSNQMFGPVVTPHEKKLLAAAIHCPSAHVNNRLLAPKAQSYVLSPNRLRFTDESISDLKTDINLALLKNLLKEIFDVFKVDQDRQVGILKLFTQSPKLGFEKLVQLLTKKRMSKWLPRMEIGPRQSFLKYDYIRPPAMPNQHLGLGTVESHYSFKNLPDFNLSGVEISQTLPQISQMPPQISQMPPQMSWPNAAVVPMREAQAVGRGPREPAITWSDSSPFVRGAMLMLMLEIPTSPNNEPKVYPYKKDAL